MSGKLEIAKMKSDKIPFVTVKLWSKKTPRKRVTPKEKATVYTQVHKSFIHISEKFENKTAKPLFSILLKSCVDTVERKRRDQSRLWKTKMVGDSEKVINSI